MIKQWKTKKNCDSKKCNSENVRLENVRVKSTKMSVKYVILKKWREKVRILKKKKS